MTLSFTPRRNLRAAFRRRYVRTAEGSRRYELPIGSPIVGKPGRHRRPDTPGDSSGGGGRHRAPEPSGPGPDSSGPAGGLPPTLRPDSQPSAEELAADYRSRVQPTAAEVEVADAYQGPGLYKRINRRLRTGEQLGGRPAEVAAGLDELMGRYRTEQPLRVYRGMGGFVPDDTSPGTVIEDLGFSSTTLSPEVAAGFSGDGVNLDITIPTGSNALVMNGIVDDPEFAREQEVLLPRGTRYVVLSEESREGKRWLNVVALPPTPQPQASTQLASGSPVSAPTATRGLSPGIGRPVRRLSRCSLTAGWRRGAAGARSTSPRAEAFRVRYVRTAAGARRYGVPIGSPIPAGRRVSHRPLPDGRTRVRLTPAQRTVAGRVFGEGSGANGASHEGGTGLDVDNPQAAARALDQALNDPDLTPGQRRTVRALREKVAGIDNGGGGNEPGPAAPDGPADQRTPQQRMEDRLAVRLLERMDPAVRQQILDDMTPEDRRQIEEAIARERPNGLDGVTPPSPTPNAPDADGGPDVDRPATPAVTVDVPTADRDAAGLLVGPGARLVGGQLQVRDREATVAAANELINSLPATGSGPEPELRRALERVRDQIQETPEEQQ